MLSLFLLMGLASAFYLPGVAPRDYADGEPVEIKVNDLESPKTAVNYDFYALPFCAPETIEAVSENLGEILSGDDIQNSPFELFMLQTESCKILCRKNYTTDQLEQFRKYIAQDYKVNWIVDNLPAATKYITTTNPNSAEEADYTEHYDKGFPMGAMAKEGEAVNNHYRLIISFHQDAAAYTGSRIVGFEVEPYSIEHKVQGEWKGAATVLTTCSSTNPVTQEGKPQLVTAAAGGRDIIWTYDVQWQSSPIKWASRWDLYLKMTDSQIHWFSILNSLAIVLFLTSMVAMIMVRILRRDVQGYNDRHDMSIEDRQEKYEEETGWKLVHGDVFRPPEGAGWFSVLAGTGVQVFFMTMILLVFACLGFLSPANRGGLMTALPLLFVFSGAFAGYASTRIYLSFNLTFWKTNTLRTAVLFPAYVGLVFDILNLILWGAKSSSAVPFLTLIELLALWLCISVPLVYLGSYLASTREVAEPPTRVNNIRREVPKVAWHRSPLLSILAGGLVPFAAIFIEAFFIMSSVWLHKFYYVFGFVALVFLILVITCAEVSIVVTYFHLCAEDYNWVWRSFLTSGSSALYLFLYSVHYYWTVLEVDTALGAVLYFGYMGLVCSVFFLLTGTIGYYASDAFVRKIYSVVKID